jgi:hypothetical protein
MSGAQESIKDKIQWWDDRYYKVLSPPKYTEYDFYPSSTTVLGIINKPFLSRWRGDVGNDVADMRSKIAMIKGSKIHDFIHRLVTGETLDGTDVDQAEWYQVVKFVEWYELFKPQILLSEHELVSHSHRYAGTMDMLLTLKAGEYKLSTRDTLTVAGGNYVLDVKTGKGLDKAYHYQTASYAQALIEMGIVEKIDGTIILHTGADTKLGWKAVVRSKEEVQSDFALFLSAKNLFDASGEDKPRVFEMPKTLSLTQGKN